MIICIVYVIVAPLLIHGANKVASKKYFLFHFDFFLGEAQLYAALDHSDHHLSDLGSG